MKLLLHICCAPCSIYPFGNLQEKFSVTGFWYNPNIHPFTEYEKRLEALKTLAEKRSLPIIYKDEYDLEKFLRGVVFKEKERCSFCYDLRLRETAEAARRGNFDYFTTTLLVSPHQNQNLIRKIAQRISEDYKVQLYPQKGDIDKKGDRLLFKEGWKENIRISKEMGLYRQQYCGCIYSEKERYLKKGSE
jgi:predicted adenine nucleotide alpha hydrolase (AANH) superfamily ATPase